MSDLLKARLLTADAVQVFAEVCSLSESEMEVIVKGGGMAMHRDMFTSCWKVRRQPILPWRPLCVPLTVFAPACTFALCLPERLSSAPL